MSSPALSRTSRIPSASDMDRGRGHVEAIRAQHDADRELAMRRQIEMANRQKAQVGFARTDLSPVEAALEAYGELNVALDAAVDELERAFARERQATAASAPDETDVRRAPILGKRGGSR